MSDSNEKSLYKWKAKEVQITTEATQQEDNNTALLPPEEENLTTDVTNLEEARVAVAQQMPPKLAFSDHARMLLDRDYTYMSGDKEKKASRKTKSSGYMRNVTNTLTRLENLLSQPAVLDVETELEKAFLDVCRACEEYLKNRNPWTSEGKARKQMVSDFYKQVSWESMRFSELVREQTASGQALPEGTTWIRFLADARTETYKHGKDDVTITTAGEATSDLHIIEKNGVKKYFKESEKLPPHDLDLLFDRELNKLPQEIDGIPNQRAVLLKRVIDLFKARDKELLASKDRVRITSQEEYTEAVRNNTSLMAADTFTYMFSSPGIIMTFLKKLSGFKEEYSVLEEPYSDAMSALLEAQRELERIEHRAKVDRVEHSKELDDAREKVKQLQADMDNTDYAFLQNTLWEIRKSLLLHELSANRAGIGEGQDISKRNTATTRMAKLLKIPGLVVPAKMTDVTINDKNMRGILMDEAKGLNVNSLRAAVNSQNRVNADREKIHGEPHIPKKVLQYSPDSLKQLLSLQVFDIICGQVYRHDKNFLCDYTALEQDNPLVEITGITAIDNDISFGQLTYEKIVKSGSVNELHSIEKNGELSIPAMDRDLADTILALRPGFIHYQMCDILNEQERKALINRITGVQKIIKKRMEWEEKQAKKGKPYTSKFLSGDDWKNFRQQLKTQLQDNPGANPVIHTYITDTGLI